MNIIIDLEHTISNAQHRIDKRTHYVFTNLFEEQFVNDRPNNNVIMFMKQLADQNHTLIILTGKERKYLEDVRNWLKLHNVPYVQLIGKDSSIRETTLAFKERILKDLTITIDFALNDVGAECAMFAKYNIPCLRIEQR